MDVLHTSWRTAPAEYLEWAEAFEEQGERLGWHTVAFKLLRRFNHLGDGNVTTTEAVFAVKGWLVRSRAWRRAFLAEGDRLGGLSREAGRLAWISAVRRAFADVTESMQALTETIIAIDREASLVTESLVALGPFLADLARERQAERRAWARWRRRWLARLLIWRRWCGARLRTLLSETP